MGDKPMTVNVPAGYAAFIFRSPDDVAEALAVQKERETPSD